MSVALRRLKESDFSLIKRWYAAPHMTPFFIAPGETFTSDDIGRKFVTRLSQESDVKVFIAEQDAMPYGYIQGYVSLFNPEMAVLLKRPDGVLIDYFIGDAEHLGKGLGRAMLQAFQRDVMPRDFPGKTEIALYHDIDNLPALRCSAAAGFDETHQFFWKGQKQVAMIWQSSKHSR